MKKKYIWPWSYQDIGTPANKNVWRMTFISHDGRTIILTWGEYNKGWNR